MTATSLRERLRALTPTLLVLYTPVVLLLALVVGLRLVYAVPMANLTRDPSQILGGGPFTGALSSLGMLLWCASASICLFAAVLAARRDARRVAVFLLSAGVVTLILLFDDLFLLHDIVIPQRLGVPQEAVYLVYASLVAGFLIAFRNDVRHSDFPLLALALGFFALSLGFDVLQEFIVPPGVYLLEDGCKLLGIVSWAGYLIRTAGTSVQALMPAQAAAAGGATAASAAGT